jgi:DNA (cytosine-5)-methyltransferase 1
VCELADFDQFMTNPSEDIRVDISHTSPPCQTWSPAKTVASANDDHNSALIFSSFNLISKVKPRIHTLEQTSGLPERFQAYYHCVIRDTLELGYSVHTKVVNCKDYGVPQTRKRLVFIAAG